MNMDVVKDASVAKMEKKRKKEKRKAENNTEVVDNYPNETKEDNQKKVNRKPEVGVGTSTAGTYGKNNAEAKDNHQTGKDKKKRRKPRLEHVLDCHSNDEICDAERDKIYFEVDDDKLFKEGGEPKEQKKRRKPKDKDRDGYELVEEHGKSQKAGFVEMDSEKEQTEKKKKKKKDERNKDDGGNAGKDESAAVEAVGKTLNSDTSVGDKVVKEHEISLKANSIQMDNREEQTEKKKKKKGREKADNRGKGESKAEEVGKTMSGDIICSEKVEKKHKREKNKGGDLKDDKTNTFSTGKRSKGNDAEEDKLSNDQDSNAIDSNSEDLKPNKKKQKVGFSDHDEVFPTEGGIVQGKHKISLKGNSIQIDNGEEQIEKKKKKKKVRERADNRENGGYKAKEVVGKASNADMNCGEKAEKKRKREKNKGKDLKDGDFTTRSTRKRSEGNDADKPSNDQENNAVDSNSKDPKPNKKKKKVSFSDHDEIFPIEGGLVQGKRFSRKEDEMVKQAVFDYIKAHDLGEEGLTMVLHCKSHSKIKNCWKEIGEALPHRPYKSVYDRAHSLFERDMNRSWGSDELEIIRKYHAEHGPKWKQLADAMGKHRRHIKDAWRRTKLPDRKKGHWSQEEYQTLFDLVNIDLKAKVNEEKKSKHGMFRDNISWGAISDTLASRNNVSCCVKWYDQLTSSMVKEGVWADTDDYHLIDALYTLDACCIEDVDWDNLLEHRSGDLCRKRWSQMANHIGEHGKKTFVEQVEILSKRYCPELLEARETWDNKPVVP